jgi:hypothetical protein
MNLYKVAILLTIHPSGNKRSKIGPFIHDKDLNDLAGTKDLDDLYDNADSICTTGQNNDGSTGLDIFQNGFELAKQTGDEPVWIILPDAHDIAFFFFGTFDKVRDEISKLPDAT